MSAGRVRSRAWVSLVIAVAANGVAAAEDWRPAEGPLFTRWAKDVSPDKVHPEYPRPQMARKEWTNLNGLWDYAVRPRDDGRPAQFDGRILVPFPIESALSGVRRTVGKDQRLWYHRPFQAAKGHKGRWLLHFGAVDWEATVWVNGKEVGKHQGGYDPFTFDVTQYLRDGSDQELVVAVWDPSDTGFQPRGKQVTRPGGIWYTPTTGIWQTVWLEPVPAVYLQSLKIEPNLDNREVRVKVRCSESVSVHVRVLDGDREVASAKGQAGKPLTLKIPDAKPWSPDSPFLYGLRGAIGDQDAVDSYFGLRKISLGQKDGVTRLLLNNEALFQFGPLDQGYWPDGIYTAPTDAALRYDIEMTKKLGFNMCRKHVKVEPERWYYWCDKLGLLVWQDMPSGDASVAPGKGQIQRQKDSSRNYYQELQALVETHFNHPSIVMWVPFNEGWGQFETKEVVEHLRQLDPTRLIDCASGWNDVPGVGDVHDIHIYPGPGSPKPEEKRAAVLGEFGGLGLPLRGHTWQGEKNWGYRSYNNREDLTNAYLELVRRLRPLVRDPGLSAAVYTQTTDVEVEVNGLMTYDRELVKPDADKVTAANRKMYQPPAVTK